jgi:hypothetical protein
MIHRLNEQVLINSESDVNTERNKEAVQRRSSSNAVRMPAQSEKESPATSSLRILVEQTAMMSPAQVDSDPLSRKKHKNGEEGDNFDDSSSEEGGLVVGVLVNKRPAPSNSQQASPSKRSRSTRL